MAVLRAGFHGTVGQPSAQVIDGSLKFDSSKTQYLQRTFGSGNRKTYTWSGWVKKTKFGDWYGSLLTRTDELRISNSEKLSFNNSGVTSLESTGVLRDSNSFYHVVFKVDTTQSSGKIKGYINGVEFVSGDASFSTNADTDLNDAAVHYIGNGTASRYADYHLSQCYFIDGQALEPTEFGFTDPLTNTWRPKKYEGTFGTNGFYLPLDGNSPIGQDKSGNGNDWTPVNFGGSVALDNPNVSGARPILNTTQGGTQAGVGVFGSRQNVGYAVTVYNDGGGNKYYIDGVKQATLTGLIRGVTYTFDTSDSTVSSHPFRFSATSNGSHGGGSEYTDGVAAVTGTATTITIPHDAPETLYYYCTSHSGMGADITGITTNEKLADQYASNCTLALPLVGANSDVSASIACTASTKSVTSNGNVAASSALSNFYSGSFYFDGTDDTLTIPDNSDFSFGSGDYTIEMWVYPTRISGTQENLITRGTSGFSGFIMSVTNFLDSTSGSAWDANITYDNPLVANKWQHIAVCRYGDTWTVYINGVANGSDTASGSVSASGTLTIGERTGQTDFQGYMNDVRLYKGVAKYTSNFIPASTNPDILPDTPSGVSGSSKLTKITDGAVSFDGTNDYLTISDSDDFNLGSGAFTIEGFCYLRATTGQQFLVGMWAGSQLSYAVQTTNDANLNLRFLISDDGSTVNFDKSGSGNALKLNGWSHFAVTRSGNTFYLFVDGILVGTQSASNTLHNSTGTLAIGARNDGSQDLNGIISNVRIIKGTALYTSRFTPPTRTLTNVTNTKLLCCQSNTSATEGAVKPGTITANGNAAATNFNPFNTDINTVRGQETGYATLNPLDTTLGGNLQDGNLKTVGNSSWSTSHARGTFKMTSGKWFWEGTKSGGSGAIGQFGFANTSASLTESYSSAPANSWTFYFGNGTEIIVPAANSGGYFSGSAMTNGDTAGVALDMDNGTWQFFKNGVGGAVKTLVDTDSGSTASITELYPYVGSYNSNFDLNFGQKPFKFPPPDGFQPLNAANVRPDTVIVRPDQYVGIVTYTGTTGSGTIKDDNIKFTPDFVWLKSRSNAEGHALYDTVRGSTGGNFYRLRSDTTAAQNSPTNELSSMIEGGFTVNNNGHCYSNGYTYVAWTWKAGGSSNTFNVDDVGYATASAAGITDGDAPLTGASVGTKQGFSIVRWTTTGTVQNFSHALSIAPDFIIAKSINGVHSWRVFHKNLTTGQNLLLDGDGGQSSYDDDLANVTSTVVNVAGGGTGSTLGPNIAYCWHDVPGLQKFGIYEGNNNSDGPFVELGFRPSIIWMKNIDASGNWIIYDNERDKFNGATKILLADTTGGGNANDAFVGSYPTDFLSNGFKIRNTTGEINGSNTYIYCAWAEAPSVDLFGGGANAR